MASRSCSRCTPAPIDFDDDAVCRRLAAAARRCRCRCRRSCTTPTRSASSASRIWATSRCRRISARRRRRARRALSRRRCRSSRVCSSAAPSSRRTTIRRTGSRSTPTSCRGSSSSSTSISCRRIAASSPPVDVQQALSQEWSAIVEELAGEPRVLCHRDYHSRNLMLHDGSLFIIDFQDARMGPDTYDLVSLLRDSYVDLDVAPGRRADRVLPGAASTAPRGVTPTRRAEFRRRFDVMALQRNLKALGTFGYQTVDARQPGLHPVHSAHAQLRARQPGQVSAIRPAAASCWPTSSRNCETPVADASVSLLALIMPS